MTSDLLPCLDTSTHNARPKADDYNMGGDERGQEGSGLLQAVVSVSLCVCCWHGDLVRDCRTTGPPQKTPPFPQMCSPCIRSLCWGPGGRNYTRDDPVLLGPPAFQVGLTFVGWVWSYPPPSVATTELIPLMSSYTDHHIATLHMLSFLKIGDIVLDLVQR